MQKENIVARGEVKVLLDYLARTPYGLTRDWIAVPVTILTESETAHTLRFEQADLDKYAERCAEKKLPVKELPLEIAKDNRDYKVDYSEVMDFYAEGEIVAGIPARFEMFAVCPTNQGLAFETAKFEAVIVDQTDTLFKLVYSEEFAKKRPFYCQQWMPKSKFSNIDFI